MQAADSVVRSQGLPVGQGGDLLRFTRHEVGWDWMSLRVTRVMPGEGIELRTENEELALVLLEGNCHLDWGRGRVRVEGRKDVFDGFPHALYLPDGHRVECKAETMCEFAECRVPSTADLEPQLITPDCVSSSLRGGENSSRQIVDVIPAQFAADKLMVVEVYTPGGNWSSYPPHKHDVQMPPAEVDLDEIYYYRLKDPKGFALQNLYTSSTSKDRVVKVHSGDAVLVRDGYHPVVAGPGYDTYYLNFLAGNSRIMAVTEDPDHSWLRSTWKRMDARLPLVGQ
jgi:5-deoxy-glucuronate isomerase